MHTLVLLSIFCFIFDTTSAYKCKYSRVFFKNTFVCRKIDFAFAPHPKRYVTLHCLAYPVGRPWVTPKVVGRLYK